MLIYHIDTSFDEEIKGTLTFLQFINDEVIDENRLRFNEGYGNFVTSYRQSLNILMGKKTSVEDRHKNLKLENVERVNNWLLKSIIQSI